MNDVNVLITNLSLAAVICILVGALIIGLFRPRRRIITGLNLPVRPDGTRVIDAAGQVICACPSFQLAFEIARGVNRR